MIIKSQTLNRGINDRTSLPDYILSTFLVLAVSALLLLDGFLSHQATQQQLLPS